MAMDPTLNPTDGEFEYHVNRAKPLKDVKEPAIVLFGWGGCSDKYLAKYSKIYDEKHCSTFRCIVSPKVILPGQGNEARLFIVAEKIVSIMYSLKFEKHPLYFHCFSNAGSLVYSAVSRVIRKNSGTKFQIEGCIFDSGPAKIYASNIARAAVQATKGNVAMKYTYAALVVSYMYVAAGFTWFSSLVHCHYPSSERFAFYESLANEPNMCPQLFLYSKIDDICPYESIQEFIEIRKSKNVQVTSVLWEDSLHVKHYVKFEKEYIDNVLKFIEPSLSPVLCALKESQLEN